jgi:hypothetical protein
MIRLNVSLQNKHYSIRGSKKPQLQMMVLRLRRLNCKGSSKLKKRPRLQPHLELVRQGIMGIVTEGEGFMKNDGVRGSEQCILIIGSLKCWFNAYGRDTVM